MTLTSVCLVLLFLSINPKSFAQNALNDVGFNGQFFISYEYDRTQETNINEFSIKRGYITFRKHVKNRLEVRFTQDVTIDQQGDGAGDIELRLKYALANYSFNDIGPFTSINVEAGVVHRPWIDFEQDINDYRAQNSMMLDQTDIISSADFGLQFSAGIGENLERESARGLNSNPARYGSFAIGVYNGGGYASLEQNSNKVVEGRLTLRPFPDQLAGLQLSLFGAHGKGNLSESPDFSMAGTALSFESSRLNVMLQGAHSFGDSAGNYIVPNTNDPYNLRGWSIFTEADPFRSPIHFTFRYDNLYNQDLNQVAHRQWIGGIAYVMENRSKLIFDVSRQENEFLNESSEFTRFEIVAEIRF
jgi:hypothetical protein